MARTVAARKKPRQAASAETLAKKQREISISEFFTKNRHLLGFDNRRKALLTAIKEAVDNSLDACEEAGVPPDVSVVIEMVRKDDRFRMIVEGQRAGHCQGAGAQDLRAASVWFQVPHP